MKSRFLFLALAALVCLECDSGSSPVAPKTGVTVTVTVHPPTIEPFGTCEIRVLALQSDTGTPARTGTEFRFSTDDGTVDDMAVTDSEGVARATFRHDGISTSATVTVSSGTTTKTATIAIASKDRLLAKFTKDVQGLTVKFTDASTGAVTNWLWDFGDGRTSTERHPLHEYREAGEYRVFLTVSNPEDSDTTTEIIPVGAVAKFTFTVATDGLTVSFDSTASTGNPIAWDWDFGDGSGSNLQNPKHTYAVSGEYRVRLEITTANAGSAETSQVILVQEKPTADFFAEVNGLEVRFEDRSTGNPTSWAWDFGDGALSSRQNPTHTYAEAGSFSVKLTVANAGGEDDETKMVKTSARLEADFSFAVNGLIVEFTNETRNGPATYLWDFGDPLSSSNSSTKESPAHTFSGPGTYTVTLTATKSSPSEESIITKPVTVQ